MLDEVAGLDAVELGCGTAYVSAWLLRLGARSVVGLDNSPAQLATARQLQQEFDLHFPLVQADAERAPLRSGTFDLAVSEYGAAIWCDPYRWIPEAARLLRPGGRLVFLGNSTLLMLCAPDEDEVPASTELVRPQRGMHRFEWPDDPGVEFHLSHGDMIRLLRTERLRGGGPDRALPRRRRHHDLRTHAAVVGRPVADRRGLDRPQARLVAEVGELQRHAEVGLLQLGDDGLELVTLLAGHAHLLALGLALDPLQTHAP